MISIKLLLNSYEISITKKYYFLIIIKCDYIIPHENLELNKILDYIKLHRNLDHKNVMTTEIENAGLL